MRRSTGPVLFLLFFLSACGPKGDPQREPIVRIAAKAEKLDAEGVVDNLTADYKDVEGWGRAEALAQLKRYFFAYDGLKVDVQDLKVEPAADGAARATFRASVSGTPKNVGGLGGLLPSSAVLRFEVRLVPEGDTWKIAWASWRQEG